MHTFEVDSLVEYETRYEAILEEAKGMYSVKQWLRKKKIELPGKYVRTLCNVVMTRSVKDDATSVVFAKASEEGAPTHIYWPEEMNAMIETLTHGNVRPSPQELAASLEWIARGTDQATHPSFATFEDFWWHRGGFVPKALRAKVGARLDLGAQKLPVRGEQMTVSFDECNFERRPFHSWSELEALLLLESGKA